MEDNKVKTQILFACKFYLFPYLQLFIDKYKCIITTEVNFNRELRQSNKVWKAPRLI